MRRELYFCGQITVPTGQLREIGIEAQRIAKAAKAHVARAALITFPPDKLRPAGLQPSAIWTANLAAWYGQKH